MLKGHLFLLAWHLASEMEVFWGLVHLPVEEKFILTPGKWSYLTLLLQVMWGTEGPWEDYGVVGFLVRFCVPRIEVHPHGSKSTLKSLKVFCMLHFKSWVSGDYFPQRFICTHKAGPWLGSSPHRAICQFQRSREWRHSCPIIRRFLLWTLQLDIEKSGFDLFRFFFFFSSQLNSLHT